MRRIVRGGLLAVTLVVCSALPSPRGITAQTVGPSGRVLAAARGQVAWLDLLAPRPTPLTQLVRPAYPADVAAAPGVPYGVASIVSAYGNTGGQGGDLVSLDLQTSASRPLLARVSDAESLDLPAVWPDGHAILYQRSDLRAALPMPGQAQPQFRSQVEQVAPDGSGRVVVLEDARYPGPAPDGTSFAFVRSTPTGAAIVNHNLADGSDTLLVGPGTFLALAYPRYSPDGQRLVFAAISLLAPIGLNDPPSLLASFFETATAAAHGFPWEAWMVNADGSDLHQLGDVIDDDPSVAWSPDGTRVLVYGGWGSFLIDVPGGTSMSMSYLAGYGSVAWLPD